MKTSRPSVGFALPLLRAALLALTGCQHYGQYLDTTPRDVGAQVLTGTVVLPPDLTLPADAIIIVRLLDTSRNDLPVTEQTIARPAAGQSLAFQLDYQAADIQPPHHARLEARVSYGGQLRLMSGRTSLVTPANAGQPFRVPLGPLGGAAP